MPLVKTTDLLADCKQNHYAVGAFNINGLDQPQALIRRAEELGAPLIVVEPGVIEKYVNFEDFVAVTRRAARDASIPVSIHLSHGLDLEQVERAARAGFTSVMYDGSHEADFETNLARTAEIVKIAHNKGISVEAEVGGIGGVEDGVASNGELADPEQCTAIADLGVDFLACGIGTIHGLYPANWAGLSFDRLSEIKALTGDLPLVLHGGTGIPVDQVQKAISLGVSKINVNTACQLSVADATRKYIEAGKDLEGKGFDPRKLLAPGAEAIKATVREKIELFGSANKA